MFPSERILPDNYPIYAGYAYLADGEPFLAEQEASVGRYKRKLNVQEIRSCDIVSRSDQKARWR